MATANMARAADGPADSQSDLVVDLLRQLRTSAQLQHAWVAKAWQAENGLHPAAALLLAELDRFGECRPSELAKRRLVDLSVVSRQIAQLDAAGLITRRPAPEDGRASLISVSPVGAEKLARWRAQHVELLRAALEGWHPDQIIALIEQLDTLNVSLRDVICVENTDTGQ